MFLEEKLNGDRQRTHCTIEIPIAHISGLLSCPAVTAMQSTTVCSLDKAVLLHAIKCVQISDPVGGGLVLESHFYVKEFMLE